MDLLLSHRICCTLDELNLFNVIQFLFACHWWSRCIREIHYTPRKCSTFFHGSGSIFALPWVAAKIEIRAMYAFRCCTCAVCRLASTHLSCHMLINMQMLPIISGGTFEMKFIRITINLILCVMFWMIYSVSIRTSLRLVVHASWCHSLLNKQYQRSSSWICMQRNEALVSSEI